LYSSALSAREQVVETSAVESQAPPELRLGDLEARSGGVERLQVHAEVAGGLRGSQPLSGRRRSFNLALEQAGREQLRQAGDHCVRQGVD
jgi:hypothetical protein